MFRLELGKILQSKGLMLNTDKTEMLCTTTIQQLAANGNEKMILETTNEKGERIRLSNWIMILGVCFDSNLTFRSHLEMGENVLIPQWKKRRRALKFLGKWMSTNQRKGLA